MTRASILTRNRENAQRSTGPLTLSGKAASRRNTLRHGLTANPAAGAAEDPQRFRHLLRTLAVQIQPRGMIEEALVHRIAVCIWRQQRAAVIDGAITGQATAAIVPDREEVQHWIERILDHWKIVVRTEPVEDRDLRKIQKTRIVVKRPGLGWLDEFREKEIMRCGAAIMAMHSLLDTLSRQLEAQRGIFGHNECEQLAWLLGQYAACFSQSDRAPYPDECPHPWDVNRLIGEARKRPRGSPMPEELTRRVAQRCALFRHQADACEEPYRSQLWTDRTHAAMLPDEALLNRIIRYEVHNDRALYRALEQLAKLRGVMVERLAGDLKAVQADGSAVQFVGERTVWRQPPDAMAPSGA